MSSKKKEVGKGIRALLGGIDKTETKSTAAASAAVSENFLSTSSIEVNPFQPRTEFEPGALEELAESIKVHGVIVPITVRKISANKFQIISGERRWRASQKAGLEKVPCFVREANDQEMLEMAIVENIQRENLNAIEVAISFQRLIDECSLTHESLADRVGKKRATVTNYLRILKLPAEIQQGLKSEAISMGHAKALAGMDSEKNQLHFFHKTKLENWSVRQLEEAVRKGFDSGSDKQNKKKDVDDRGHLYADVENRLRSHLGTKVAISYSNKGKGAFNIKFTSDKEFNRILDIIMDS